MKTAASRELTTLVFDLPDALAPISAEHPSGESLRYDGLYDSIKELRREDDPSLPQGVWKREYKKADWERVAALSLEALETRTKDLQLASWLLEAWIQLHGFPGAEQGFRLVAGLCEDFWDDLHPQIEDGMEFRLGPVEWMATRLILPLNTIPITRPETDEAVPYGWADWESARHLTGQVKADKQSAMDAEAQEKVTQAKFLVSASLTPTTFFQRLAEEMARCLEAVDGLSDVLDKRCGEVAPSFAELRDAIEGMRHFVTRNLRERMEEEGAAAGDLAEVPRAALEELDDEAQVIPAGGPIISRADAFRRLNQAADYLLRTEPHSPAAYLVKRAVSWGNLSLAELLQELLDQNTDLQSIYTLLGIRHMDSS